VETRIKNSDAIIVEFMEWMESRDYATATKKYYRLHITFFLNYLRFEQNEIEDLSQIDRAVMARYNAHLKDYLLLALKAASEQRNSALRAFFKCLREIDVLAEDPLKVIEKPLKIDNSPVQIPVDFFREDEIQKLFSAHDTSTGLGRRNKALIEVMYYCGLRNHEVSSLKVEHIDLEFGGVKIPGARKREISLYEGCEALKEYGELGRPMLEGSENRCWFFLGENGWQMDSSEVNEVIQSYVERSGISSTAKPLTMRNSRALHMLYSDIDLRVIQTTLGFKDLRELEETFRKLAAANSLLSDIEEYLVP